MGSPFKTRMNKAIQKFLTLGDIVGWFGAILLLGAYLAVSMGLLSYDNFWYQIMNITGSLFMFILAAARHAKPSAITNIIWAAIGIIALIGILF